MRNYTFQHLSNSNDDYDDGNDNKNENDDDKNDENNDGDNCDNGDEAVNNMGPYEGPMRGL